MFIKVVVAVCLCIATATSSRNFFRRDYTYFEEYNAFYKLHEGEREITWQEGFLKCDYEGAQLFYPADDNEWRVIANITDQSGIEYIYVGVRDEFGVGDFITTDGRFIPELNEGTSSIQSNLQCGLMSVKTGAYIKGTCEQSRPYICKKLNNEYCPTADSGYIFSKSLKKCFKFNDNANTWANAMHTCIMEGGVLSDSLVNNDISKLYLPPSQENNCYYIGFQRIFEDHFYSSRGQKITITSQDGAAQEECSCLSNNNEIRAVDCQRNRFFICEMDVNNKV